MSDKRDNTPYKYIVDLINFTGSFIIALIIGFVLQSNMQILLDNLKTVAFIYGVYLALFFTMFQIFKIYSSMWRYFGLKDLLLTTIPASIAGILFTVIAHLLSMTIIPFAQFVSFSIMLVIITLMLVVISRMAIHLVYLNSDRPSSPNMKKLAIVGGGSVCAALLNSLANLTDCHYLPICIFDDNPNKKGRRIEGVRIVGDTLSMPKICKELEIDEIIIAIPSATDLELRKLFEIAIETGCKINTMPSISDMKGVPKVDYWKKLRKVDVEDLLERSVIDFDITKVACYIESKVILITGAGGSIGSEIARQVASFKPSCLVLLDVYENSVYEIQNELLRIYGDKLDLFVEIASIRDEDDINKVFEKYRPQIVFHAAAHKHVPLMETNPEEAVKNNIFGTRNVIIAADKYDAERFVLISTDKAVNPTNVMGATKRFCEMMVQSMKSKSNTIFAAVRFGNVLGSNGSVIPLFKSQIESGGPVTVTHPEIERYFMIIPEAVRLVLLTGATAESGNVYVLDMGKPVRISEFARKMIILSGFVPDRDIKIVFTGLRPGEKLYEELIIDYDRIDRTSYEKIFIEKLPEITFEQVMDKYNSLVGAVATHERDNVVSTLADVVGTYTPDWENLNALTKLLELKFIKKDEIA